MSDISLVGLGRMGSALGRTLVKAGRPITVWNRTPGKMQPLAYLGASPAETLASAVSASPVVLVCIDSYETTRQLFQSEVVLSQLTGKIIVQLSTGSPNEARDSDARFKEHGAHYLDGAILAEPASIGTADAMILYSGEHALFERCMTTLSVLAEDSRYVGEDVGRASALDLAWLIQLFGSFIGAAHGAIICEAEKIDVATFSRLFPANGSARWFLEFVERNALEDPDAALAVWNAALKRIRSHAQGANISRQVPDFVGGILNQAEADGFGEEHIAAITKALRKFKR